MVSFQCDGCADTVKKPQLDKHRQRCWAPFTCLDCSTTFQNQDYKSHTSCISEAEKYQGALYRGPKKAQPAQSAPSSYQSTPADSPAPSEAGASGIHPSRLNQLQTSEPQFHGNSSRGRGGFGQRGGRGGFGARGGGGFGGQASFRPSATGENRLKPENGMRTWGSAPTSESEMPATPASESGDKKKKKRKGDKGGTGAKANSRLKSMEPESSVTPEEPAHKKRKREGEDEAPSTTAAPSDKTVKRLRKHMSKLEDKVSAGMSLNEWLQQVGQGKEKSVDRADILQAVQVAFVDGKWQMSVGA